MNIEDMSEKGLENLRLGIVEQAAEDYIFHCLPTSKLHLPIAISKSVEHFLDHSGFRCFVISSLSIL